MPKMLGATLCDKKTGDVLGRVDYDWKKRVISGDALSCIFSGQEVTLLVDIAPGQEKLYLGVVVCCRNGDVRWQFEENRK